MCGYEKTNPKVEGGKRENKSSGIHSKTNLFPIKAERNESQESTRCVSKVIEVHIYVKQYEKQVQLP